MLASYKGAKQVMIEVLFVVCIYNDRFCLCFVIENKKYPHVFSQHDQGLFRSQIDIAFRLTMWATDIIIFS